MTSKGSLACVGIGITLGSHISLLARSHIEHADVVPGVSDSIGELRLTSKNKDVHNLQPYYRKGKSRKEIDQEVTTS